MCDVLYVFVCMYVCTCVRTHLTHLSTQTQPAPTLLHGRKRSIQGRLVSKSPCVINFYENEFLHKCHILLFHAITGFYFKISLKFFIIRTRVCIHIYRDERKHYTGFADDTKTSCSIREENNSENSITFVKGLKVIKNYPQQLITKKRSDPFSLKTNQIKILRFMLIFKKRARRTSLLILQK